MDGTSENRERIFSLEKIASITLGTIAFLLPFFFIPSLSFGLALSKGILLTLVTLLALALYFLSVIKKGELDIPANKIILSTILLPVVFLLSALVKGASTFSVLGYVFEVGTVVFIALGFLTLFLVSQLFRSKEHIFYSYLGFLLSFVIIVLFHLVRLLFGANVLSFGIFTDQTGNLIGNWNDLAIFFGAASLLSLITLEMVALNRRFKILVVLVFALSLIFLAIVNFISVWVTLAVFSLVVFLYVISFDRFARSSAMALGGEAEAPMTPKAHKISYMSLALLILSVIFIFGGRQIGDRISTALNIASLEVRPSWGSTLEVSGRTLKESPVFGAGPNMFTDEWLRYKPAGINDTIFWNVDFTYGIGLIPTFLSTTGVLGVAAWLFFFGMIVMLGIRAIFTPTQDLFSRYLVVSSFLVSIFFWVAAVVYVPSIVNFILAFFFTGLFLASLYREGIISSARVVLTHHPKVSFLAIFALIMLIIGAVGLGYLLLQNAVSYVYFQKGAIALNRDGNLAEAEASMVRAVGLGGFDIYSRALSEINLLKVNEILNREGVTADDVRDEFQETLGRSIENALAATRINPRNYQNWVSLGRIYAELVAPPFAVAGAYENALEAYNRAGEVNPTNPALRLLMARLEVVKGDLNKARDEANAAIALKANYADAHFLVSQIEVAQGNLSRAIPSLETTLILSPNNPGLFFQLGILKYNRRDFMGAIEALERAVVLVPDYANAKYFLGLSYSQVGERERAIRQFEEIEQTNPDNKEVKTILANLRAGKTALAGIVPPPENLPERRGELPLSEN